MYITTHVLASIVISQHTPNAGWAFLAALLSHYLLDFIPHGDKPVDQWVKRGPYFKRAMVVFSSDMALLAVFFFTFFQQMVLPSPLILAVAIIGGVLPDVLWVIYDMYNRYFRRTQLLNSIMKIIGPFLNHHKRIHNSIDFAINKKLSPNSIGLVIQFIFLLFFVFLAMYMT